MQAPSIVMCFNCKNRDFQTDGERFIIKYEGEMFTNFMHEKNFVSSNIDID